MVKINPIALVMTVGTGVGTEKEKIESLAHGLYILISKRRPDLIVFCGSEASKETVKVLRDLYGKELQSIKQDFLELKDIDSINSCFETINCKVSELLSKGYKVEIDYTSGTRSMSAAAVLVGFFRACELYYIAGTRKNGKTVSGTEYIRNQNVYSILNEEIFKDFKNYFNTFNFSAALEKLNHAVLFDNRETYESLARGYMHWDLFEHSEAYEELKKVKLPCVAQNKEFLGKLVKMKECPEKYVMLLADIINNAIRRIDDGRYIDATGRLYRAVELIAQILLLEKYELDDFHGIPASELKKVVEESFLETLPTEDGKLKVGLHQKFEILKSLGYEKADEYYLQNWLLKDLIKKRNESILAHGVGAVSKDDVNKMCECVLNMAKDAFGEEKINELLQKSKFVKL